MAIRKLRFEGDDCLKKICKKVPVVTPRIRTLALDMIETMYEENGVGLAAPQVGVVKRLFVVDVGDGPIVMINPVILETSGEQTGSEGCLSVPGKAGQVTRPNYVKAEATNLDGERFTIEGEGLLARAILHENDHLDGILYTSKVEGDIYEVNYGEAEEIEEE